MISSNSFFQSFIDLLFPRICAACGTPLLPSEEALCINCTYELPRTNFYKNTDNKLAQVFWGRIQLEFVTALFRFEKGSKFQHLIHELKYKGNTSVGLQLGKELGLHFINNELVEKPDYIIPVPLHRERLLYRGYNQSEIIGTGVSLSSQIPINVNILERIKNTSTQTLKNRFERWQNVEYVFVVRDSALHKNKHFLLIDDVITTGSTIEACANALLKIEGAKVSVASLAYA